MAISGRIHRGIAVDPRITDKKPYEMHTNAKLFVQDGIFLGNRHTAGQIHLMFHGIELALKAFLLFKGLSEDELRINYRHGLSDLIAGAQAQGMTPLDPASCEVIGELDAAMERARLRYEFSFRVPLFSEIQRVAETILEATRPPLPPTSEEWIYTVT